MARGVKGMWFRWWKNAERKDKGEKVRNWFVLIHRKAKLMGKKMS